MLEYVTSQIVLQEEVIPMLAGLDVLGIDIETRGSDPNSSTILSMQFSSSQDVWVIDTRKVNVKPLLEILVQTNPLLIGHNLKYDLAFLRKQFGFEPKRLYDTMLAYGICYNGLESPYVSLRYLVQKYSDVNLNKDIRDTFRHTYGDLSEGQIEYAGGDVRYLHEIFEQQLMTLTSTNMIDVARLEFSLIPVIVDMELTGVKLDQESWAKATETSLKRARELEYQIQQIVGSDVVQNSFFGFPTSPVNPRSNRQMLKAFHEFGFGIEDTSEGTIKYIGHPLAKTLLEYRKVYKLATTYGENVLALVRDDGRLHTEFNQLGTQSGRLSSSGPNLQNIPGDPFYRRCFVSDDGNLMVTADWNQIEYKIAAIMSREERIIEEYREAKPDFHGMTAANIFCIPQEEVTREQRYIGKTTNFSVMYMISKFGLARRLGIKVEEADQIIKQHRKVYPKLTRFMEESANIGAFQGHNETKMGRCRYYNRPPRNSANYAKKIFRIRREAGNHPVQGTAADIMKLAMIEVYYAIKEYGAHIVSTVHDELVVESPREVTPFVAGAINNKMEEAAAKVMGNEISWDVSLAVGGYWKKA